MSSIELDWPGGPTFEVHDMWYNDKALVLVTGTYPDMRYPHVTTDLFTRRVARYPGDAALAYTVREALIENFTHEIDERLFFRGKLLTDPHPELHGDYLRIRNEMRA